MPNTIIPQCASPSADVEDPPKPRGKKRQKRVLPAKSIRKPRHPSPLQPPPAFSPPPSSPPFPPAPTSPAGPMEPSFSDEDAPKRVSFVDGGLSRGGMHGVARHEGCGCCLVYVPVPLCWVEDIANYLDLLG
jgi:hypothetical protein